MVKMKITMSLVWVVCNFLNTAQELPLEVSSKFWKRSLKIFDTDTSNIKCKYLIEKFAKAFSMLRCRHFWRQPHELSTMDIGTAKVWNSEK